MVYGFYNIRRAKIRDATPNAAHSALARLERDFPGTVTLVTQNIDDLHERAGSRQVIHMHGEAMKARCLKCLIISPCETTLDATNRCPACGTVGALRPHIVWFGEIPLFLEEIDDALTQADLFVAIGTSGVVYPAAGLAELAARHGIHTIEINPASTEISPHFDEHLRGPATEKVPAWVDGILSAAAV